MAQQAEQQVPEVTGQEQPATAAQETIIVTGIRQTIQDSIQTKKNNDLIVDALSADEIGDLPALSIGEALETLTGAASHREQGGATEIAIRGLGPFLSSTTINGRIATNGSGDRSVNFSQFPSELFNKIAIYKTQSASLIEGGVAGQIQLESVRPLDYGKRRIQAELKVPYNPDNLDIDSDQRFRTIGYRGTISYVDQFEFGDGAELGISVGYSRNRSTNPEQEANTSNTLRACKNDPTDTGDGVFDDGNCDTSGATSGAIQPGDDFVIVPNSYVYRSNITDDERDAVFAAVQFQPNPDIDINADIQYSKRLFKEQRSDFGLVEGRRIDGLGDANALPFPLEFDPGGILRVRTSEQRAEATSEYLERDESYLGGGLSASFRATDRLRLSADASYSRTKRVEEAVQIRFRTENQQDIFGNDDQYPLSRESDGSGQNDRIENAILIRKNGSEIFNFLLEEFDPRNYALFRDSARLRADLEQDRYNKITAYRADAEYELFGFFSDLLGGVRYQNLIYEDVPGASGSSRFENTYSDAALAVANQECRTPFPESGFLKSVSGGNPLITIVDSSGNVLDTANSFATFDALCVARVLEREDPAGLQFDSNGIPIYPDGDFDSIQNNDVTERTWAAYVQANFDSDLGALPVRGNVGVRLVNTKVKSIGFRTTLSSRTNEDGTIELIEDTGNLVTDTATNSYTELLPSFNVTAEFRPDLLGRFAVYRALSRPDPSALGFGRSFASANDDEDAMTIEDALGVVTALGNPATEPLLSWNGDVAIEWYPNRDTILALGAYYKSFAGGFDTITRPETFLVDGQPIEALVSTTNTTGDNSKIYGFELTAAHRFSYLPRPLDGLGFKISYNYANSDFEFEDDVLGASTFVASDGTISRRVGLVPPAEIFGLSKHVLSAQLYYQLGPLDVQGVYKYRSNYFQQFVSSPGRIRYVDDTGVFEARVSYKLTDNVRLRFEGINLFNEPRVNYRGLQDNLSSVQVYGPRYFAGVRVKF